LILAMGGFSEILSAGTAVYLPDSPLAVGQ
jgi:hypothetical protein